MVAAEMDAVAVVAAAGAAEAAEAAGAAVEDSSTAPTKAVQ